MGIWELKHIAVRSMATIAVAVAGVLTVSTAWALDLNNPPPAVVATWERGVHVLPSSATRSGVEERVRIFYEDPEGWEERVAKEILKPGVKLPAVVFLHGCGGYGSVGESWASVLAGFGFAFFAPNSYARPGRQNLCYRDQVDYRNEIRNDEALYAAHQARKLPWIDHQRLVLMGFSEGAFGAYDGDEFSAQILLGSHCGFARGSVPYMEQGPDSPLAPSGVAVLNIVGSRDEEGWDQGCLIRRDYRGSKVIVLQGRGHYIYADREAIKAVAEFLTACCGFTPVKSGTVGLDAEETARKLVEEIGSMATLEAMLKADDARGKADEEGHKFWMRVHEIATKLTGG